jgi:hypothetical protein
MFSVQTSGNALGPPLSSSNPYPHPKVYYTWIADVAVFKPLDFDSHYVRRPANHVWWGTYLGALTVGTSVEDVNCVAQEQYINIKGMEGAIYDVKGCDAETGFNRIVMLVRVHIF